jgi:hypothetical protein
MEISKATYDKLVDIVNLFTQTPSYELEGKYKGDLSKDEFSKCIQFCKTMKMQEKVHEETLDVLVRFDDVYRVSFIGKPSITELYKSNRMPENFENTEIMKKTIVKGVKPIYIEEVSFKVDLKDEQMVEDKKKSELSLKFPSLEKGFRFKKRFSYVDVKNGMRYDFSLVRTSKTIMNEFICHKTFAQSGTLQASDKFELEIEVVRDTLLETSQKRTKPSIVKSLISGMIAMHLNIHDEKHFMSNEMKSEVLKGYLRLCYSAGGKGQMGISAIINGALKYPKKYFIGPQTVTLEKKNVVEPGLGIVSIVKDYTVTEKADGERCLLYVANDGKCYIINNRLSIKYTGVKLNRTINTILDGEYITRDVVGRKTMMFGVFDIYYYNGQDVRGYPLINEENVSNSRMHYMQTFTKQHKSIFEKESITIITKDFKYETKKSGNIFQLSKEILEKDKAGSFPYKIDGLIFTPKNLPVGGMFAKDEPSNVRTWEMVFKWKPHHENTIDFLVRYEKDNNGEHYLVLKNDKYYKRVNLYVGYNPSLHERLTAMKFLTNNVRKMEAYVPKEFIPGDVVDASVSMAYLDIEQNVTNIAKSFPKCRNGDVIEDNSIVEFAFDTESGEFDYPLKWIPNRVRGDKTEMYRKFGLSGTANDYKTALNVWSSIHNPVTEDIISGHQNVSINDIPDEDVYFTSTLDRYKYASIVMKNFHNEFIKKRELIMKMPQGGSILDIACGKAGDLNKWIDAGFKKVMGIDVVRDNIEHRTNGAYARTLDIKHTKSGAKDTSFVYLTMDGGKRLTSEYVDNLEDIEDKQIAKILWGITKPNQIKDASLQKYHNYMQGGFDVISCQFAIHYLFENETTLDNFIYNVDTYLKPGGYFIGTCLDGHIVKDKLRHLKKGQSIQGTRDERVLWNIKKLYSNNTTMKLGEQVEIFMESIGKPIKEYLVDFNLLKSKLAIKGIEMLNPEDCKSFGIEKSIDSFQTTYGRLVKSADESKIVRQIREMSAEEKEYSFLNSWFIFKKY